MTDRQFELLLGQLDRIAAALERMVPAGAVPAANISPETVCSPTEREPPLPPISAGPSREEPVTLVPDSIRRYLEARGIRIRRVPPPNPADPVLDRLALFLGRRHQSLRDVLAWLKRTMQTGNQWRLSLAGRPQEVICDCCQFCHQLHQMAFLTEYRYYRSPRCLIEARTSPAPEVQNFLSGQWLERFVRQQVEAVAGGLQREGLSILANAQITLPNNDDFELDLLVELGGAICWIEAKTGAYQQYVRKYARMAHVLGLNADRSFLVLSDVPAAVCGNLSQLTGMTVCPAQGFQQAFGALIAGADQSVAL